MQTRLLATDPKPALDEAVAAAVELLRAGQPVALPTETVYGLAAVATDAEAVQRVFDAKQRPAHDPLIVHVNSRAMLDQVARIPPELADIVATLTGQFWPGALTLVLPKAPSIPDQVTSGLPTVAVRRSAHPVFARVIKELQQPLAAPSANRFGRISPTSARAVQAELDGRVPLILDGGACAEGVESTIIKPAPPERPGGKPILHVLRAGPVTPDDLKRFGKLQWTATAPKPTRPGHPAAAPPPAPEAPGMLEAHYSPVTPLRLLASPDDFSPLPDRRYALLSYRGDPDDGYLDLADFEETVVLSPGSGKLPEAAVRFYFLLRHLDELGVDEIIAEPIPERGIGIALQDRLRRAAAGHPPAARPI